ncbi:MAG: hypothetical protein HOH04_04225 [Rhodospirillaceae bacterium]|nr:hypothetical protein [Rhodospirillaceae bacterium]
MPLQNRVTPDGQIIATPARGTMMGNRGVLHDENRVLGRARWRHKNWVACRLEFNNRHRRVMTLKRYTELFFLDEAVAFAAGHRPCAECRRADYNRFKALWMDVRGMDARGCGALPAKEIDNGLHTERAIPRQAEQKRHSARLPNLPDGAFVMLDEAPHLVLGKQLLPYAPEGYGAPFDRPRQGAVTVLTPPSVLAVFRAGYQPMINPPAVYPT